MHETKPMNPGESTPDAPRPRVDRENPGTREKPGARRVITPEEALRNRETLMQIYREVQRQRRLARGGR